MADGNGYVEILGASEEEDPKDRYGEKVVYRKTVDLCLNAEDLRRIVEEALKAGILVGLSPFQQILN
jgi:hypothetical protein